MRCVSPFVKAGAAFGCGRCLPCLQRLRRVWMHRIMLEASCHDISCFATLTYDDSALPRDGSVKPEHLRDWLKRFRRREAERYPWRKLRFFAVGEYGDRSSRPHYHLALFGTGCDRGGNIPDCGCETCCSIRHSWGVGHIFVQPLVPANAAYLCGYVAKKLERNRQWLHGRHKEFSRMSLKPGLGAGAMWDVASTCLQYRLGVVSSLSHGAQRLPLGQYLRRKLQERIGEAGDLPMDAVYFDALRAVRDYAFSHSISQKEVYRELNEAYASQLAQRASLNTRVL